MNYKVKAGLAVGIVFAISTLFLGLMATWFNWGTELVNLIGSLYIGYDATFVGSIAGFAWAFIDGFIVGFLVLWVYEKLSDKEIT